jgi:hypothetical protein
MKSIYNIYKSIFEGILSGMDSTLAAGDIIVSKDNFIDWVCGNSHADRNYVASKVEYKNSAINFTDRIYGISVKKNTALLPKDVKLGMVHDLYIMNNQEFFDKCKHQLPKIATDVYLYEIDIKDFEIQAEFIDLNPKSIKNLVINVPEIRQGMRKNSFEIQLPNTECIEEIKINGVNNITVDFSKWCAGEVVCNHIKKFINKYKKTTPCSIEDVHNVIINELCNYLPMDYIDKNWKGIKRIVFKDKSGKLRNGDGLHWPVDGVYTIMKPGDFIIEKQSNGQWKVYERMFKR